MSDDVIGKADALMRRHRVFVAGGPRPPADEDVPILTEVVDDGAAEPTAPAGQEDQLRERVANLRALQDEAVVLAMEAWLAERLPAVVAEAIESLSDQVATRLEAEVRDNLLNHLRAALDPAPPAAD